MILTHNTGPSAACVAAHCCCTTCGRLDHLTRKPALPAAHTPSPSSPQHCCLPLCLLPLPPGYCDTQLLSHPLSRLRMRLAAGAVDLALQAPPSAVGSVVSKPGERHATSLATPSRAACRERCTRRHASAAHEGCLQRWLCTWSVYPCCLLPPSVQCTQWTTGRPASRSSLCSRQCWECCCLCWPPAGWPALRCHPALCARRQPVLNQTGSSRKRKRSSSSSSGQTRACGTVRCAALPRHTSQRQGRASERMTC